MLSKLKRKTRNIILSGLVALVVLGTGYVSIKTQEDKRTAVAQESLVTNNHKALFFYRDNCRSCNAIFPFIYVKNLVDKQLVLVNTNNLRNRYLAQQLNVETVPSIFYKGKKYNIHDWLFKRGVENVQSKINSRR